MNKYVLVLNNHGLGDVVMSFSFFENLLKLEKNKIIVLFKTDIEKGLFKLTKFFINNKDRFILLTRKDIYYLVQYIFRVEKGFSLGINENMSIKLFRFLFIKDYFIANPYKYKESTKKYIINNEGKIHKIDLYNKLLNIAYNKNILFESKDYFVELSEKERKYIFKNYLLFATGSGEKEKLKRWTIKNYGELILNILKEFPDNKIIFVGSKSEITWTNNILNKLNNSISNSNQIVNLVGKTNIPELINLCKNSLLVFGSDNGILHIASACNSKVLGLFGPTNFKITGPRGKYVRYIESKIHCSPCYPDRFFYCKNNICMQSIKSNLVLYEMKKLLKIKGK